PVLSTLSLRCRSTAPARSIAARWRRSSTPPMGKNAAWTTQPRDRAPWHRLRAKSKAKSKSQVQKPSPKAKPKAKSRRRLLTRHRGRLGMFAIGPHSPVQWTKRQPHDARRREHYLWRRRVASAQGGRAPLARARAIRFRRAASPYAGRGV